MLLFTARTILLSNLLISTTFRFADGVKATMDYWPATSDRPKKIMAVIADVNGEYVSTENFDNSIDALNWIEEQVMLQII